MKEFIKETFSEGSKISSKRVITVTSTILIIICVLIELFTTLEVRLEVFEFLVYLSGGGMVTIVAEKFGKNKKEDDKQV